MDKMITYEDSFNVSITLITLLTSICLIRLGQFYWRRRDMNRMVEKIPGPEGLPFVGILFEFMGDVIHIHRRLFHIFQEYDPIAKGWFGHKLFFLISKPEHYETILNSPYCMEKNFMYKFSKDVVGTGLFSAPLKKWKKNRKIISPTFNPKILNSFVEVYAEQGEVLTKQLKKYVGKKDVDLYAILTATSLDVICETAMGIKVNAQTTESEFGKWTDLVMSVVFKRMVIFFYHVDFVFNCTPLGRQFRDAVRKLHNFTGKVVAKRKRDFEENIESILKEDEDGITKRKPFLDLLLRLSYDGAKFTEDELRQEVDTFCIGGSDTTAVTMGFCLAMLGMHQDLQQKVYAEAIDVIKDRAVTADDLPVLKYLERFVKETLRLFPAVPFIIRASQKDIQLEEFVVPANSSIVCGFIHTHRSPKYWNDPLKFDPDRFLPESVSKRHPYAFAAFSGGPRGCIGQRYAIMAVKGILATVIRKYKIFCDYKSVADIELKSNMGLRPTDGFKVRIEERTSSP